MDTRKIPRPTGLQSFNQRGRPAAELADLLAVSTHIVLHPFAMMMLTMKDMLSVAYRPLFQLHLFPLGRI